MSALARVVGLALALGGAVPAMAESLTSLKVQLPQDDQEFAGAGSGPVNGACLSCHSAEMVFAQPKLSASVWTAEVNKMRKVFKAPIADADVQGIVDYLVKLQAEM